MNTLPTRAPVCANCRHFTYGVKAAMCHAPSAYEFDPVFGRKPKKDNAHPRLYRSDPLMCGDSGIWYEPKFLVRVFGV
jgi:hypothetical protein